MAVRMRIAMSNWNFKERESEFVFLFFFMQWFIWSNSQVIQSVNWFNELFGDDMWLGSETLIKLFLFVFSTRIEVWKTVNDFELSVLCLFVFIYQVWLFYWHINDGLAETSECQRITGCSCDTGWNRRLLLWGGHLCRRRHGTWHDSMQTHASAIATIIIDSI